jgi:hypothetical protein
MPANAGIQYAAGFQFIINAYDYWIIRFRG